MNPNINQPVASNLRSVNSTEPSYVQFVNLTGRHVKGYWIGYNGNKVEQFVLESNGSRSIRNVNTFVSHPWFFRDACTGEFFLTEAGYIFTPQRYQMPHPTIPNEIIDYRKQIKITLPPRTLAYICCLEIIKILSTQHKGLKNLLNAINSLCIPATLKTDLKIVLKPMLKFGGGTLKIE